MEARLMHSFALSLCTLFLPSAALAGPLKITTGTLADDYAATPLEFEIRGVPESDDLRLKTFPGGKGVPCQIKERGESGVKIVWLAPELKKGSEEMWEVDLVPKETQSLKAQVEVKKQGDAAIEVLADGKEFTRLLFDPREFKPYFFPILGPNEQMITRQYPMNPNVDGEDKDHPHQRSLWFTHGSVGGVDFWSEGAEKGKIRQTAVESFEGGPVFGRIATKNEWITPAGKGLLDDRRVFTFFSLPRGEKLIDVSITLTATHEPVVFGDTKEGTFGIRLAESMKESRGGKIVNSAGQHGMDEAWGSPADWVDYFGPVGGETVGVAILDHPQSFRHPTHWHVRNYGLFAANPFGYHDFYEKKKEKKDGKYTLEKGQSMEFRYRVFLHRGTTEEAKVSQVYRGFATPPTLHPRVVKKA
jgi:hypothetical protein